MVDQSRLLRFAALLAIGAWMLLARPYEGLRHDGVLYLGQALLNSRVPGLGADPFFAGGSQDRYSIYAQLMVPLYKHLGMLATHVGVVLASWLLMMGAVLALLRRLDVSWPLSLWGVLAFAVMSPFYGGTAVIGYGEPFVTARSFAEPLLLWSLVALLHGRHRTAAGLLALAAALHPLMTLPVIAVTWCYLVQAQRRWLWLLAAIPAMLVAAVAGIPPWQGLLKTYDPYWWSLVETANRMVVLSEWTLDEHLRVVLDVAILLAASRLRPADAWTRLIYALAATTVAFIGLTALGADALQSVLMTQLQLWRAHWVAHLVAMALAPWLVVRLCRLGGLWPVSGFALVLALMVSHIGTDHGAAALSLWALVSLASWRIAKVSRRTVWLACGCILLCALGLQALQLADQLSELSWQAPKTFWSDGFFKFAAAPAVAACGFAALMHIASKTRSGAAVALGISTLLLLTAASAWDQRPDVARAVESRGNVPHPFAAHLPANATVYWPNHIVAVWSLLERPGHYASQQGAGLLFNRDTALIFGPRKEMYRLIKTDRDRCRAGSLLSHDLAGRIACDMPSLDRLTTLCNGYDTPDYLVLPGRLPTEPLAMWRPPTYREPPQNYALYACSQLKPQGT